MSNLAFDICPRRRRLRFITVEAPCGKVIHPTEHSAALAMEETVRRKPYRRHRPNVYFCERCNGFHWGNLRSGRNA